MHLSDFLTLVTCIATLIIFFVMAVNIRGIKKKLKHFHAEQARTEYFRQKILDNKNEAYEALLYFICSELRDPDWHPGELYKKLKSEHEHEFIELGYKFPEPL